MSPDLIPPGSTIGILGGGQLGRMLALAAAPLGYRVQVFAPEDAPVAAAVAAGFTRGDYADREALAGFARRCDVITYEFENVPAAAVRFLEALKPVRPGAAALDVAQDRLSEKRFANGLGGRTAPFHAVDSIGDLQAALAAIGAPAILKTRRFGYDGKGQAPIDQAEDAPAAFARLGEGNLILEGFVSFAAEFSILVARFPDGNSSCWPACRNQHQNGILAETRVPAAGIDPLHVAAATALAVRIAESLRYVGVLACEFFACADGPCFNEMAPRVHNSGHWTIEGAETSQFEQHVRAICGLPPGPVALTAAEVSMRNLLGAEAADFLPVLADRNAHLHLYGKREARPGRKMGHVTRVWR